jgi:hypothetical protein
MPLLNWRNHGILRPQISYKKQFSLKIRVGFFHSITLVLLSVSASLAQETIIRGKVTDAGSGDPLPFVNVVFKGTSIGGTTDFDGKFVIRALKPTDSVIASYIGYKARAKKIKKGVDQVINFQLEEELTNLQEVVVKAGENPAWEILRGVVRNRDLNDKRKLEAYEYDVYTKTEVDIDNITEQFREKKVMKKIAAVLDSVDRIVGEDGKPVLPLFITEGVSKFYYREKPQLSTETILRSKINGVGIDDGTMVTQLVGSTFQEYNFYQNWVPIINKNFVSPLADGWKLYYDYDLLDSLYLGNDYCYRIDFYPKSPLELAFTGSMWITKKEYALKQIDASIGKSANVNFIDRIKIQQELTKTEAGQWLPLKNRVLINISELSKNSVGLLAKFYTSNKNFVINQPKEQSFYERRINVAEDATVYEEEKYWDTLRHEPLSSTERSVYQMIDTLKNIPVVKTYTEIFKAIVDGYYSLGKVEVGPYLRTFTWNSVEGFRIQGGFKTNSKFSKKMMYGAMLAYGFDDHRVKASGFAERIIDRKKWTTFNISARTDIIRLSIDDDLLSNNQLFLTAVRWGNYRRAYYFNEVFPQYRRDFFKGFTQRFAFRYHTFEPTYPFAYYKEPEDAAVPGSPTYSQFQSSEFFVESRYARDETYIQNGNERVSLGLRKWPAITFRYTRGVQGLLGSDFDYNKFRLQIDKRIRMGLLGVGFMTIAGEYIPDRLPYPLLAVHLGNQSFLYSQYAYNLMNFGEFVSDRYVTIRYRQFLEGLLLNRIPLMNKLKWRLVATTNIIYGELSQENRQMIASQTPDGQSTYPTGYFSGTPYVEVGYGVENIFHFFRVDFVHRLTYLDRPDARPFGVVATVQFKL